MQAIKMRQRRKKRLLTDDPESKALPLLTPISWEMWLMLRSQEKWNGVIAFDDGEWTSDSDSFVSTVIIVVFSFFMLCLKGFNYILTLEPGPYPWFAMTWEMSLQTACFLLLDRKCDGHYVHNTHSFTPSGNEMELIHLLVCFRKVEGSSWAHFPELRNCLGLTIILPLNRFYLIFYINLTIIGAWYVLNSYKLFTDPSCSLIYLIIIHTGQFFDGIKTHSIPF